MWTTNLTGNKALAGQFFIAGFAAIALAIYSFTLPKCKPQKISKENREKLKELEFVEVFALAFMRGMNIDNSILIFEEGQNATPSQMKLLLTRIGFNSKFFISGDVEQSDRYKNKTHSGLWDAIEKFRDDKYISTFEFKDKNDIVRNPLISKILQKYGNETE